MLVVAVLFGVGWIVYQPVYNLLINRDSHEEPNVSSAPAQSEAPQEDPSSQSASQPQEPDTAIPQSSGGRTVYLPAQTLADQASLETLLANLKASGTESILIDLKDADGRVLYSSGVSSASASVEAQYDLTQVTQAAEKAGLSVTGRLWAFQDKMAATVLYDSCVKYNDTTFNWLDRDAEDGGKPWLNPYVDGAQLYILDLMAEAMEAGVKNFVLAGVQFPSGISLSAANYGDQADEVSRAQVLSDFMTRAEELAAQQGGSCWYQVESSELLAPGTDPLGIYGGDVMTAVSGHRVLVDVTPQNLTQEAVDALGLDAQQQSDPIQVIAAQLEKISLPQVTPYLMMDDLSGGGAAQVLENLSAQPAWQDCEGYVAAGSELLG